MTRLLSLMISEFKYFARILDESGTYDAERCRNEASEGRVAGAIRPVVNTMGLQLECVRVLHEAFLIPALL